QRVLAQAGRGHRRGGDGERHERLGAAYLLLLVGETGRLEQGAVLDGGNQLVVAGGVGGVVRLGVMREEVIGSGRRDGLDGGGPLGLGHWLRELGASRDQRAHAAEPRDQADPGRRARRAGRR